MWVTLNRPTCSNRQVAPRWTLTIILHIGVVQLRVAAAGKWTPEEPERYLPNPIEPPQPFPGESHLSYAQRYLSWSQPCRTNPDWLR